MAVPGLRYVAEYLAPDVHDALLAAADAQPWQQPSFIRRRVQVYGYTYNHTRGGIYRIGDLPHWVTSLAEDLVRDRLMTSPPDQLIVNEYRSGTGIQPHVDHAAFDDTIVSISLGSGCVIELGRPLAPPTESVFLEPRSALVLSGDARHHWTHGIAARDSDLWDGVERPRGRRISLTFRTMLQDRVVS
jgi:alkylated DNA repair dioxygenase AlkB